MKSLSCNLISLLTAIADFVSQCLSWMCLSSLNFLWWHLAFLLAVLYIRQLFGVTDIHPLNRHSGTSIHTVYFWLALIFPIVWPWIPIGSAPVRCKRFQVKQRPEFMASFQQLLVWSLCIFHVYAPFMACIHITNTVLLICYFNRALHSKSSPRAPWELRW